MKNIRAIIAGIYALLAIVAPAFTASYLFGFNSSFSVLERFPLILVGMIFGILLSFVLGYLFVRFCDEASYRSALHREDLSIRRDTDRKSA